MTFSIKPTADDVKLQHNGSDVMTINTNGVTMGSGMTLDAGTLSGTIPASVTVSSGSLSGALPAIDGSALTGLATGGLGKNQTWQDLTSSRAFATTYTNTTGEPIFISVEGYGAPNHGRIEMFVDNIKIGMQGLVSVASAGMSPTMNAVVPHNSTYRVNNSLGASLVRWTELR